MASPSQDKITALVTRLEAMANRKTPGGLPDPEDWRQLRRGELEALQATLQECAGHFTADQLFRVLWSCAILDLPIFSGRCGNDLLNNLARLPREDLLSVSGNYYPGVIWALSVFFRKYGAMDPALEANLLQHVQWQLDMLAVYKTHELAGDIPHIFQLAHTKVFLKTYAHDERLFWDAALEDLIDRTSLESLTGVTAPNRLETSVWQQLKATYTGVEFTQNHLIPGTLHRADIAIPSLRVAIEIEGPHHFYGRARRATTKTECRNMMIEDAQWTVITIPYYEWNRVKKDDRHVRKYLQEKLSGILGEPGAAHDARSVDSDPGASAVGALTRGQDQGGLFHHSASAGDFSTFDAGGSSEEASTSSAGGSSDADNNDNARSDARAEGYHTP